jgi:hypothetical protein
MAKSIFAYGLVGAIFLALSIYCLYLYLTEDTCGNVYSILMYVCIGLTLITVLYYFFGPDPEDCNCAGSLGDLGKGFGKQIRADLRQTTDYVGAGILPIAKNPTDGKTYVLLGLENFTHKAQGRQETGWLDFGGKKDHADQNMLHTALREFSEETCRIFDDGGVDILNNDEPIFTVLRRSDGVVDYGLFAARIQFIDAHQLNEKVKNFRQKYKDHWMDSSFWEKQDFVWIEVSDFVDKMERLLQSQHSFIKNRRVIPRFVGGAMYFGGIGSTQQSSFLRFLQSL